LNASFPLGKMQKTGRLSIFDEKPPERDQSIAAVWPSRKYPGDFEMQIPGRFGVEHFGSLTTIEEKFRRHFGLPAHEPREDGESIAPESRASTSGSDADRTPAD
ncbi:MAG: hypothetical protein ABW032_04905, partial [Burkholderiaceae bacterium]